MVMCGVDILAEELINFFKIRFLIAKLLFYV